MLFDIVKAIVLGVVEGLTEFVPVSSTGHLLLVEHFFGFGDETFGKSFAILIQFGAVLALLSIYFLRLWKVAIALPYDPKARRFVLGVLIAFLPAMVIGVTGGDSLILPSREAISVAELKGAHERWLPAYMSTAA